MRAALRGGSAARLLHAARRASLSPRWFTAATAAPAPVTSAASAPAPLVSIEYLRGADAGLAVLTLSRAEGRNALSRAMVAQLSAALRELSAAPPSAAVAVVLASSVPRVFCAGADLAERAATPAADVAAAVAALRALVASVAALPMPTVAALDGAAVGGGLELALACDLRVASEGALLALPEAALGVIPGAGGCARLPRLVGPAAAKALVFGARRLRAAEAAAMGLVHEAVAGGGGGGGDGASAAAPARARALELARGMLGCAPLALRAAKAAMDGGLGRPLAEALDIERDCYASIIGTADRLEGLAAFREKRAPVYRGL